MRGVEGRTPTPWAGWSFKKPGFHQRSVMKEMCGRKCFLGKDKSFPICNKGTCKISDKGLWSAYVRAKEFGSTKKIKPSKKHGKSYYRKIANKSKKMLRKRGSL